MYHTWNQSIVQQLTNDGNLRRRDLKASPMGLIASTMWSWSRQRSKFHDRNIKKTATKNNYWTIKNTTYFISVFFFMKFYVTGISLTAASYCKQVNNVKCYNNYQWTYWKVQSVFHLSVWSSPVVDQSVSFSQWFLVFHQWRTCSVPTATTTIRWHG